jgi:hypothetical protein
VSGLEETVPSGGCGIGFGIGMAGAQGVLPTGLRTVRL